MLILLLTLPCQILFPDPRPVLEAVVGLLQYLRWAVAECGRLVRWVCAHREQARLRERIADLRGAAPLPTQPEPRRQDDAWTVQEAGAALDDVLARRGLADWRPPSDVLAWRRSSPEQAAQVMLHGLSAWVSMAPPPPEAWAARMGGTPRLSPGARRYGAGVRCSTVVTAAVWWLCSTRLLTYGHVHRLGELCWMLQEWLQHGGDRPGRGSPARVA